MLNAPTFATDATFASVLSSAGLDWEPVAVPAYAAVPVDFNVGPHDVPMGSWLLDGHVAIPDTVALRRSDTGDVLGRTVSDGYGIVYNRDAAAILDACGLRPDRAESLNGGRRVLMIARPEGDGQEIIPGDVVRPYVVLDMRHDGGGSVTMAPFFHRIQCTNQIRAGLAAAGRRGDRFVIRHTVNARARFARAGAIMQDAFKLWDGDILLARSMADTGMSEASIQRFIDTVIPCADDATDTVRNRVQTIRDAVRVRMEASPACNLPGMRGTVWSALNAVTEHVDHGTWSHARGEPGSREREEHDLKRTLDGAGAKIKAAAWTTAVEIVG